MSYEEHVLLGSYWQNKWPTSIDVISPDYKEHINYVPLMPWDGENYHCIYCSSKLHGYQRRCSYCGQKIYGYEDNSARVVLDVCKQRSDV